MVLNNNFDNQGYKIIIVSFPQQKICNRITKQIQRMYNNVYIVKQLIDELLIKVKQVIIINEGIRNSMPDYILRNVNSSMKQMNKYGINNKKQEIVKEKQLIKNELKQINDFNSIKKDNLIPNQLKTEFIPFNYNSKIYKQKQKQKSRALSKNIETISMRSNNSNINNSLIENNTKIENNSNVQNNITYINNNNVSMSNSFRDLLLLSVSKQNTGRIKLNNDQIKLIKSNINNNIKTNNNIKIKSNLKIKKQSHYINLAKQSSVEQQQYLKQQQLRQQLTHKRQLIITKNYNLTLNKKLLQQQRKNTSNQLKQFKLFTYHYDSSIIQSKNIYHQLENIKSQNIQSNQLKKSPKQNLLIKNNKYQSFQQIPSLNSFITKPQIPKKKKSIHQLSTPSIISSNYSRKTHQKLQKSKSYHQQIILNQNRCQSLIQIIKNQSSLQKGIIIKQNVSGKTQRLKKDSLKSNKTLLNLNKYQFYQEFGRKKFISTIQKTINTNSNINNSSRVPSQI